MDSVDELLKFVHIGARLDLKAVALEHILGMTGSEGGAKALTTSPALLTALVSLLDDRTVACAKDATLSLINISANKHGAKALLNLETKNYTSALQHAPQHPITTALRHVCDPQSPIGDACAMLLSNLTRQDSPSVELTECVQLFRDRRDELLDTFAKGAKYNQKGATLDYLGPVLSNLTQDVSFREWLLSDAERLGKLIPFVGYEGSVVRRGGAVGALRNCCFDTDTHAFLLHDVDLLPTLLLPLAGGEEFDDEDNDKLPVELQYLPSDKERESDPDIRCMLIEALTQLCTKRTNRELIRNKNAYVIMRELHKWEEDERALVACENLVDLLIRTEEEINAEDLSTVEIPDKLQKDFENELKLA